MSGKHYPQTPAKVVLSDGTLSRAAAASRENTKLLAENARLKELVVRVGMDHDQLAEKLVSMEEGCELLADDNARLKALVAELREALVIILELYGQGKIDITEDMARSILRKWAEQSRAALTRADEAMKE